MPQNCFVIGIDYGTDSVRSVIVNAINGDEISASVFYYPRWRDNLFCHAATNQFRQHPLDYIEGLEFTIKDCLQKAGKSVSANIKAISVDTTGSTPVAVNKAGTPLALLPGFESNPNAMFVLWKDHTATAEAAAINAHAADFPVNYLQYAGGIYSSEWFWSKLLHILRVDNTVRQSCYSWVEHCDWIPFLLTGGNEVQQMKRSVCAAGHKALWATAYGGLPPNDFFASLDPLLDGFTKRLFAQAYTADQPAGYLCSEWAERLGLNTKVVVGVGAFDAHMGAVGGEIEPYHLSRVMGTSTCDMLVAPMREIKDTLVKGICGQVPGSVIPGMMGLEAGQSAFGDVFAWFKNVLTWPVNRFVADTVQKQQISDQLMEALSEEAANIPLTEKDELAIDWLNGRRTPDANQLLKAALSRLNLGTDAPRLFKALNESICFGARAIIECFIQQGVPVKGLIGLGGVARKAPFTMQTLADVTNMPIRIHRSEQTCAMGAAMFAATVAGIYPRVEDAMKAMGKGFDKIYTPDASKVTIYNKRYRAYQKLGDFIQQL